MESELYEISRPKSILKKTGESENDSEYWEFLLMLGFGNPTKAEQLYKTLRSEIPSGDWKLPLVEIGEARILSLSGRDFESYQNLLAASKLIFSHSNFLNKNIQSEITALYYYVLTTIQEKIRHNSSPFPFLLMGKDLTSIDTFKLAFSYNITVNETKWLNFPISNVLSVVHTLEQHGLWTLACIGYRTVGILSRMVGDFSSAHKYYDTAYSIASRMNLDFNLKQLHIAKGYAFYREDRLDEAEEIFSKVIPTGEEDPILPILYENLALIAKVRLEHNASISFMKRASTISTKLDSIATIPGEYLYLGQVYENHYKDFEQAEYYYKQGYDHAMRYANHGISLTGDRKDVVDAYVKLIKRKQVGRAPSKPSKQIDHFAFAQGKPWKDIKDIFQHQLICFHQRYQPNSKALANKLDMPASTLYSLQDRLKKRGYQLPQKNTPIKGEQHNLFSFIEEHEELTWDAINSIFEREIIHYLYEKYGYNKQRMAQVLKLSYPSIITKTRELTQVNEHLLPN